MNSLYTFRCLLVLVMLTVASWSYGQSIRLDNLRDQFGKGKPFKLNGALSANGIYYNGNGGYGRDPFSYFVNGSMNLNLYGLVNLPFLFTLTSFGSNYSYPVPPNRFSIHPSYKSVTAHIGNIAATYSPYTLNGYLFTGAGVDVEPKDSGLKVSGIYGRLQKAVEYDTTNHITPATYERMGWGSKVEYQKNNYRLGMIAFHAWDDVNSIQNKPDSLQIYPMANTVLSVNAGTRLWQHMDIAIEYATSAVTEDVRAARAEGNNLFGRMLDNKESTGYFHAIKSSLQYTFTSTILGVGYERIDPGYRTLGAYYLNNDLENITVNAAQPLFKSKVQLTMNMGFQRDNLDHAKSGSSTRFIGALNVSYTPSDKVTSAFTYSNFQTFMRIRPQFVNINRLDNFQNLDTLDYTQVSQNATASASYMFSQTDDEMKGISVDLSFQETADEQGGVVRNGNLSQFYNASVLYTLSRMAVGRNFSAGFNVSYNTIGRDDFITMGPIASISASILQKKITTGANLSYNASRTTTEWDNHVFNVRCHAIYKIQRKHTFNLNVLNQWRSTSEADTNDVTVTVGYNFIFGS